MLAGTPLIDAHVHVPSLSSLRPAWLQWARDFGPDGILEEVWDVEGRPRPERLDALFAEQGVDIALLFCEYSPKATGVQQFDDLLPLVEHNPRRFRPVVNVNPHLHFPITQELTRQLDHGAAARKLHPVHGGFRCDDTRLYPAYALLEQRQVPLVVHCGTSSFPGSANEHADPQFLLPVVRDVPGLHVVLAHGGRGWWYDTAAFMALSSERVWIELLARPPLDLRHGLAGGGPGTARNARAVADLLTPESAVAVLRGNAQRVYAALPPITATVEATDTEKD